MMYSMPKVKAFAGMVVVAMVAACSDAPQPAEQGGGVDMRQIEQELPALLEAANAAPVAQPEASPEAKLELGRALYFDPILSGNKDTNCAVCHHPTKATTISESLAVGTKPILEDGVRLPSADHSFLPRNPPDLFNLGDPTLTTMFWDRRMEQLPDGQIVMHDRTAGRAPGNYLRVMPEITENLLAGQVIFPLMVRDELRGDYGELDIEGEVNELANRTDVDFEGVWRAVMRRLMAIEGYREMFAEVYPEVPAEELTIHHFGNALAAFIIETFTFTDAPFDDYLRGDEDALTDQQKYGAWLFFGDAGCADCHSGALLTDQKLHNIGVRPITAGPDIDSPVDLGASHRAVGGREEAFAFRTPSLRNVTLTGPWMHNGAYTSLERVIRHKTDMHQQLWDYDYTQIEAQFWPQVHKSEEVIGMVEPTMTTNQTRELQQEEVEALVAFLESLTSPTAATMGGIEPESVPSGLPIPQP